MSFVMHRFLMAAILAFSLAAPIVLQTGTAFACSCEPPNLSEQFETADVAFTGEVESVDAADSGTMKVEFEAEKFLKGTPSEHVTVYTANNSAACGYAFEEGTEYFVLARSTDRLETNLCQFNVNMDDGSESDIEAIEALGEGQEPDDDDPPSQGNGDGDEPTDDGNGSGRSGDGDGGANGPDEEADSASDVDPDPLNVSAVVLAGLVAAAAVVVVAGRK